MKKSLLIVLIFPIFLSCNPFAEPPSAASAGYTDGVFSLSFDPAKSEKIVVDLINDAEESIDIALYGFSNENICNAILKAAERHNKSGTVTVNRHGVRVNTIKIRCVTEYDSEIETSWARLIEEIRDNPYVDIDIHLRNDSGIMHNKYFIVDKKYLITGSTNLTEGMLIHFNNMIAIKSPSLCQDFQRDFEVLRYGVSASGKGNSYTPAAVSPYGLTSANNDYNAVWGEGTRWPEQTCQVGQFSIQAFFTPYKGVFPSYHSDTPSSYTYWNYDSSATVTVEYDNAMNVIFPLIENAKKYIYIYSFAFSDKTMIELLMRASARGVEVRVWMDYMMYASQRSNSIRSYVALVKTIKNVKICRNPNGGLLHHKVIMIDDECLVLGSLNFSDSAVSSNDENFLVIKNAKPLINAFLGEMPKIDQYSKQMPTGDGITGFFDDDWDTNAGGY